MDERIISALIGGVVVALGWAISFWMERHRARLEREDRIIDIQTAIRAEIKAIVSAPQNRDLEGSLARGMARFDEERAQAPYVPLVPHEKHDTVFEALVGNIHLLPTETVEPVVLYYNSTTALAMLAGDLRSQRFAEMDKERRKKMLRHYMLIKIAAKKLGEDAIAAIDAMIGPSEPLDLSRRDPARSDPSDGEV